MARNLAVSDMNKSETFSRVLIDGLLAEHGWKITIPNVFSMSWR